MRFIRTALKAWGERKRGWVEGWRGGGAFLCCFAVAITAAAETGVCL